MQYRKAVLLSLAVVVVLMCAATGVFAQAPGGRGQGRGNFDPAAMQQRMAEQTKAALDMTDEEWAAVEPLLTKVDTLSREVNQRFGRGNRGNRGGRGNTDATAATQEEQSAVAKAFQELQTAVQNADSTVEDVEAKLTAYREARETAKQELDAAKQALREVLTLRQEAALVVRGILD